MQTELGLFDDSLMSYLHYLMFWYELRDCSYVGMHHLHVATDVGV